MSFRALQWAARLPGLTAPERAVLVELASRLGVGGTAWPSVATMVSHLGLSERTVRRSLTSLIARGLITVEGEGARKGGRAKSTAYRLTGNSASVTGYSPETRPNPTSETRPNPAENPATVAPESFLTSLSSFPDESEKEESSTTTWVRTVVMGPKQILDLLWKEAPGWLVATAVRPHRHEARGVLSTLLSLAGERHPGLVLDAFRAAVASKPDNLEAYLTDACTNPHRNETARQELSRKLGLTDAEESEPETLPPAGETARERRRRKLFGPDCKKVELSPEQEPQPPPEAKEGAQGKGQVATAEPEQAPPAPILSATGGAEAAPSQPVDPMEEAAARLSAMDPSQELYRWREDLGWVAGRYGGNILELVHECEKAKPPYPYAYLIERAARSVHPGTDDRQ